MKKIKDSIFYSATDLSDFQRCSFHIINDIKNFDTPLPKKEITETLTAYINKGNELELKYLKKLDEDKLKIFNIKDSPEADKDSLTKKLMREGYDYIYQPHFKYKNWVGHPDIIKKINGKSKFGNFSYIPIDIKLSAEPKTKHVTQVLVYCYLISKEQDFMPDHFIIVNGQQFIENKYQTKDFIASFNIQKLEFENFIINKNRDIYPEKCEFCNYECEWTDTCSSIWEKDKYLNLVANISRTQINKLKNKNILSLPDLANTSLTNIKGIGNQAFDKLKEQALLQLHKLETNEDKFVIIENIDNFKGFNRLPPQNNNDLFFDIEGDPTSNEGLEYLFGLIIKDKNKTEYKSFWAHNCEDERISFISLMNFLKSHIDNYPDSYIYHYSSYEITALKRLSIKYDECSDILDFFLRNKKFVDLYVVVRESIRISEPKYSIKNLETFYMKERTSDVQKGSDSVDMYIRWKETNDEKILDDIELYNTEDCISTKLLFDWLVEIKADNYSDLSLDKISEFQNTHDHRYLETKKKLNKSKHINRSFIEIVTHLLEFYRREVKSEWWTFFNRQNHDFNEILNDMDAIGGLVYLNQFTTEDGYVVKTFKYPEQDFKLKSGTTLVDIETLKSIGSFYSHDYKKNTVSIKLPKKMRGVSSFVNVSIGGPIRTDLLSNAIYLYAENLIAKSLKFKSVNSILQKQKPEFKGKKDLETIIKNKNLIEYIGQSINALDHSYLFIQGPPGTGKTYITGRVIHDLIKKGKKVAISSNSHKVIHNLLDRIEEFSKFSKLKYVGIKKSTSGNKESEYISSNISSLNKTTDSKNPDLSLIPNNVKLFAATKYELCKPIYAEKFDYIFIDEAGQISIADMVVSGMCAKNIILIGDPQQLPQPSQLVHPGEGGLSILEFLLEDKQTIPKDKGIFMDCTRRLNTPICNFISNSFYDGRLKPIEENDIRKILDADFLNIQSGIIIYETNHTGNTQKSEEEGKIINDLYNKLIGKTLVDENGKRKIILNDILTIAPYNVQVNYLSNLLPAGSRVGTIDKFQGQESAISILSMTSSEQENIPRGINFLFSANRLNVAISRTRSLSIVLMNKPLFNSYANTIKQLKLINNFSSLRESIKKSFKIYAIN